MTLLEKISFLMDERQLNKRQLSIKAGMPYSTIDNLWKRGTDSLRLPTFRKICDFFGVTMDSMAHDEKDIEYKTGNGSATPPVESPEATQVAIAYDEAGTRTKTAVEVALGLDFEKEDAAASSSGWLRSSEDAETA